MKTKRRRLLRLFLLCLFVAASCGGAFLGFSFLRSASVSGECFRCQAMEVPGGYGYVVTALPAGDTLIVQPYIPALGGYTPFPTRAQALEAGRLVCRKLSRGEAPTVSREEMEEIVSE